MFQLNRSQTALVIVDIQERLVAAMDPQVYAKVSANVIRLAKGAAVLDVPAVATQQYTRGLGETMPEIRALLPGDQVEKISFSCCGEDVFNDQLATLEDKGIQTVILTGIESHVCVLQTALDLMQRGLTVHIVADAVMSRRKFDWETSLRFMERAGGAITVTETVLFQLLGKAGTPEFKEISRLVK